MKDRYALRLVVLMLLFVSCIALTSASNLFELELVPVSKLLEQPSVYDSTLAYRKISVIGNISELGKFSVTITADNRSLKTDAARLELFNGFQVGDQVMLTGEFRHDPIGGSRMYPNYVLHYPVQNAGHANISDISTNSSFNGKYLTTIGNLTSIELVSGRYIAVVSEPDTMEQVKVVFYGTTDLKPGEEVKVSGLYNGGIIHTENFARNRSPLSISTLIPGFSSLTALAILGAVAILLSHRQHK